MEEMEEEEEIIERIETREERAERSLAISSLHNYATNIIDIDDHISVVSTGTIGSVNSTRNNHSSSATASVGFFSTRNIFLNITKHTHGENGSITESESASIATSMAPTYHTQSLGNMSIPASSVAGSNNSIKSDNNTVDDHDIDIIVNENNELNAQLKHHHNCDHGDSTLLHDLDSSSITNNPSQIYSLSSLRNHSNGSGQDVDLSIAIEHFVFIPPDEGTPAAQALAANAMIKVSKMEKTFHKFRALKRPKMKTLNLVKQMNKHTKTKRDKKHFSTNFKGKVIDGVHELYTLTAGMMLGLRCSIARSPGPKDKNTLAVRDFSYVENIKFPPGGSSRGRPTPPHTLGHTFKFKSYSPKAFREIRTFFGIDTASYMLSICGNYNYLEFISNSKSGQFFFYSHDGKYMIKTQTKTENKFMKSILPKYYEYISTHPHTLLVRILGMHRVKMYHLRRKVHFVIMTSVFDTPQKIHTIYDLKGSTIGREATENEKNSGGVLKDLDLLKTGKKFQFGRKKKMFIEQLKLDTQFLSDLNIMDYSLLVGVHDRKLRESDAQSALDTNQHSNTPFRRTSASSYVPPAAITNAHSTYDIQADAPEDMTQSNGSTSRNANSSNAGVGDNAFEDDIVDDDKFSNNSMADGDRGSISSSDGCSDSEDVYSHDDEGDSVIGDSSHMSSPRGVDGVANVLGSASRGIHHKHASPGSGLPPLDLASGHSHRNHPHVVTTERKSIFGSLLGRSASKDSTSSAGKNGGSHTSSASNSNSNLLLSNTNLLSLSLPYALIRNSSAASFGKSSVQSNEHSDGNHNNGATSVASRILTKLTTSRSADSLNSMELEVARPATDSTSVHPWTMRSDMGINSSISKIIHKKKAIDNENINNNDDDDGYNNSNDIDGSNIEEPAVKDDRGDDIYYVGVIDILQQYNIRKKAENLLKGFSQDRRQISAVPPRLYALRFIEFMEANID